MVTSPFVEAIQRLSAACPLRPALTDRTRTLTYRQLATEADLWGRLLRIWEGRTGPVAVLLPNSASFVAALLGIAHEGRCAVLLPTSLGASEIRHWAQVAGARLVLTGTSCWHRAEECGGRYLGPGPGDVHAFLLEIAPTEDVRPGDFIAQLTSGVDRPPKLAVRTHEAVWREVEDFAAEIDLTESDASLVLSSVFHSYGLVGGTLAPLYRGGRVVLGDPAAPHEAVSLCRRERPTVMFALPVTYRALLDVPAGRPDDLRTLRLCLSAGAPLAATVEDAFAEAYGKEITQDYGCTEAGVITLGLERGPGRRGSVGRPVRGRHVSIVGPDGQVVPPGQVGEVVVESPALARGYLGGGEASSALRGGRLLPGDLGWVTEDGYLFLAGRTSSLVRTPRGTINPVEVETAIASLPGVREVAVVGLPGERGEERLTAVVAGEGITAADVIAHCRRVLGDALVPETVQFRDVLPRTPAGKILRRALRTP